MRPKSINYDGKGLFTYLEQFSFFSKADKELILKHISFEKIKKGDYFIKEGEIIDKIGFVINGAFRSTFDDAKGNEVTSLFFEENNVLSYHTRFLNNSKSPITVESILDSEVIVIDRKSWNIFSTEITNWDETILLINIKFLEDLTILQRNIILNNTETAYSIFIKTYYSLYKKIPLGHISSILGVTQSSLSRVRRNISKKDKVIMD